MIDSVRKLSKPELSLPFFRPFEDFRIFWYLIDKMIQIILSIYIVTKSVITEFYDNDISESWLTLMLARHIYSERCRTEKQMKKKETKTSALFVLKKCKKKSANDTRKKPNTRKKNF